MAKILIIDDDPDIVESLRVVLQSQGHHVESALSGIDGLKKVEADSPDLIILDIMMPGVDGFAVARDLKKGQSKNIPILMLTAIREKMGLDFRKEKGDLDWLPVDEYCEKPMDHDILIAKVNQLLSGKR